MNRFYFTPPSYSGHTLIAAILDAHPFIAVDNSYGGEISDKDIIHNSANNNQWNADTKYVFPIEGQGVINNVQVIGRTTLYEDFEGLSPKYCFSCIRHPAALFKGYVMKNRIPRDEIVSYLSNLFYRISMSSSFIIYHEKFIRNVEDHLFNFCSYLNVAYDPEWVKRSSKIVKINLPERDVQLTKEELYKIDEMINKISLLGECYGTKA